MAGPWKNQLHFGDNLDVLRDHVPTESVDLIYLDPPFNSNASYNVLFKEKTGKHSAAQITAFEDTWEWGDEPARAYSEVVTKGPPRLGDLLGAMFKFLGRNDMMAYLSMMAVRLVHLHRVLKPTGSIYLHCDPTASHYLKLLMDAIFAPQSFRNEIIWRRSHAHSDAKQGARHYGRVTDTILFYSKTTDSKWNPQYLRYDEDYVARDYRRVDADGRRYRIGDLSGPGGAAKGNPYYEFMGVTRYWRYSRERMEELLRQGRIVQTRPGAVPQYKRYLDEMPGVPLQNLWVDTPVINNRSKEFLGYPTQKPGALLERIVRASSNEGDVVLDPFCGCGTAVVAAEKLHRRWIGIDITYLAIDLIQRRLHDTFKSELSPYEVHGIPRDVESARALAARDRYQFQWWAVMAVNASPAQDKKGADRGMDGLISFLDDESGAPRKVVVQVKSGHVSVKDVRELQTVVAMEKAEIGALIALEEPTKPMHDEAAAAGVYEPEHFPGHRYPRLQILTIDEILRGFRIQYPGMAPVTFKKAERQHKHPKTKQATLL